MVLFIEVSLPCWRWWSRRSACWFRCTTCCSESSKGKKKNNNEETLEKQETNSVDVVVVLVELVLVNRNEIHNEYYKKKMIQSITCELLSFYSRLTLKKIIIKLVFLTLLTL